MHVLWHMEFHVDYSRFPAIDWNEEKAVAPAIFSDVPAQCKAYELWRRKQIVDCDLHIYQSHFADFAQYAHALPSVFFDFRVNILERRHQAFLDWRQTEEPLILLSPGVLLSPDLDIVPYVKLAMETQTLISVVPKMSDGQLSGFWVIPQNIQKVFCGPIPDSVRIVHTGNDIGYWWALAKNINAPMIIESEQLTNYLPQYSVGAELQDAPENIANVDSIVYPQWTTDDFVTWMSKQKFRLAQTMRWCPHEYIMLRNYDPAGQQEYLMAIDYLHRNAVVDVWRERFQFAVFEDGYKYWYCGVIDLLNRTSKELERRIFKEDGKDEYGRKIRT